MNQEMQRLYVRHPSDVPIAWKLEDIAVQGSEPLKNVSQGGLAFMSTTELTLGASVVIQIPAIDPQMSLRGVVVWCEEYGTDPEEFEVGVRFVDENNHFRMRMVEQICHIEHFKHELLATEGRAISGEEAALEWIKRYANDFPR